MLPRFTSLLWLLWNPNNISSICIWWSSRQIQSNALKAELLISSSRIPKSMLSCILVDSTPSALMLRPKPKNLLWFPFALTSLIQITIKLNNHHHLKGVCSVVSDSLATPSTITCQLPLSIELSKQEYYSGLPFPSPRDLPHPGIEPVSLASPSLAGRFFTTPLHTPMAQCIKKLAAR